MKESELFLVFILIALIVWLALKDQSQTIIVFMPISQRPEVEKANPEMEAKASSEPQFHGFATA